MTAELLALADKIEALDGPCRETDVMIRCAVFAPVGSFVRQSPINGAWCVYGPKARLWEPHGLSNMQTSGAFTGSIDAADSLVPKGWCRIMGDDPETPGCMARLYRGGTLYDSQGCAPTLALALSAAAIRAKATTPPASEDKP